jgi:DNA primase small subunit
MWIDPGGPERANIYGQVGDGLRSEWKKPRDRDVSLKRYRDLQDATDPSKSKKSSAACAKVRECLEDVMFQYVYPRIDSEVSKHRNHLLKSPFVIHPATGKVCVPVDPKTIVDFDPDTVPTVGQLLRELEQAARDSASSGKTLDPGREWAATSLKPYVEAFEHHVKAIMADVLARKKSKLFDVLPAFTEKPRPDAPYSWKRPVHVYVDLDRDVLVLQDVGDS